MDRRARGSGGGLRCGMGSEMGVTDRGCLGRISGRGEYNELTAASSLSAKRNFSRSANNQLCIPNRSIVSRNRNLHHKHSVSPTKPA